MSNEKYHSEDYNTDLNWQELFEQAPCGHVLTHLNGGIVKINKTLIDWLGYTQASDFENKKFQELLSIGGKLFYETQHITLAKIQNSINEVFYKMICKDKGRFEVLVNSIIRTDDTGNPFQIQHVVFPYSDRKKYESELLLAKKKAETSSKAKTAFLSTITHEIRTPIHTVLGISDMLIQENPRPDQLEMLQLLQVSSLNLLELINSILDYNKIEAGKLTLEENPFNLHLLLKNLVNSLRPQATLRNINLDLQISEDTPEYYIGDAVKLNQILTNLIGNSLKFTLEGKVEVHLESKPDLLNKRLLEFKIIDTGIGMSKEEVNEIFDPFTQANKDIHKKFGGTGLGLSISQKILEAYTSRLEVESEKGKGSVFKFELRLKLYDSPENFDTNSNTLQLEKLTGIRLLVVDDSFSNHYIINRYLNKWEVNFLQANNGTEALNIVEKHEFDIILMDLKMPDMDGFEATRRIRSLPEKKYLEIPIIAYSAATSSKISEEMKSAGMNDLILKPFRAETLHRLLKKYGGKASIRNIEDLRIEDQLIEGPKIKSFNPHLRLVEEMFENETKSIQKYLRAVIHDVHTLKEKLIKLQSDNLLPENTFHDINHSAKTIIRMFELTHLKELFENGEEQINGNHLEKFTEILEEIILYVEKFSFWVEGQIES